MHIIGSTPDDTCLHIDVTMTPLVISVTPGKLFFYDIATD